MPLSQEIKQGIACDSVGHPHSIVGRAVCLSVHPGKMLLFPFLRWFHTRYKGKYKYARTIFGIDMTLLGIALTLSVFALITWLNPPSTFEDKILFDASVAPREIVSGAPSTLVIQFTNTTEEELRNARLTFRFPKHFLLQQIKNGESEVPSDTIELGSIDPGEMGSVHIKGVMFGDVGGEQIFQSELTFLHGTEKPVPGKKIADHVFSPSRSTLALRLELPERLLAFQDVDGVITYENTGDIDLPSIIIEPEWPEGFSGAPGIFTVPAIAAGEQGSISFQGFLGDVGDEVLWTFNPSFTFGEDRYRQETLRHTAHVVPAPLKLSHSVERATLQPGATAVFRIEYENISPFSISDLSLAIESDSPFFPKKEARSPTIVRELAPGERGSIEIRTTLRSSIGQSETRTYENLSVTTRSLAHYTLGDGSGQHVTSKGATIESPLTTPLTFESFARYYTPSGDQIGRGPLPPRLGKETSFWIFWNVNGTTNPIENVKIEGILPMNVSLTGKESTSQNGGIAFDPTTRVVQWTADRIVPTFAPSSKIVGIAFEIKIAPTEDQIGTKALLIQNISLSATDANTGAFLTKTHPDVITP